MKIKILVGVLVVLIVLNLATVGSYVYLRWVKPPFREFPGFERPEMPRMHPRMRLDSKQREKMQGMRMKFFESVQPDQKRIGELRNEIFEMIQQDNVDTTAIDRKLGEIADLHKKIEMKAIEMLVRSRTFLSPQQFEFLYRMLDARPGGERPEPGMRRPEIDRFR
jgi:uncharacterized membrane protein